MSDWSSDVGSSDLVVVARAGFLDIGAHEEGPFGHVGRARLDAGQDFSVFGSPAPEPKHSDLILVAISRVDDLKVAEGLDGLGPDRERNILLVEDDAAAHGHAGPAPARSEERRGGKEGVSPGRSWG